MRIPYVAEEKDFQLEYYNQARQKISTEKFNKKELSTDYDASMSFIIGLDFSVNWDELKTIISDFLK